MFLYRLSLSSDIKKLQYFSLEFTQNINFHALALLLVGFLYPCVAVLCRFIVSTSMCATQFGKTKIKRKFRQEWFPILSRYSLVPYWQEAGAGRDMLLCLSTFVGWSTRSWCMNSSLPVVGGLLHASRRTAIASAGIDRALVSIGCEVAAVAALVSGHRALNALGTHNSAPF